MWTIIFAINGSYYYYVAFVGQSNTTILVLYLNYTHYIDIYHCITVVPYTTAVADLFKRIDHRVILSPPTALRFPLTILNAYYYRVDCIVCICRYV